MLELKAALQNNQNRENRISSTLISARFIVLLRRKGKLIKIVPHKAIS